MSFSSLLLAGRTKIEAILYPTEDNYVDSRSGAANTVFNNQNYLITDWGTVYGTAWNTTRSFMKFDITAWANTPTQVKLWYRSSFSEPVSHDSDIFNVDATWDTETLTWNNQPSLTDSLIDLTIPAWQDWAYVDITSIYNAWKAWPNYWLAIWWTDFSSVNNRRLYSSETWNSPYLEIIS